MFQKKKVSVIFPAYNEEKNIRKAVSDFFSTGVVDEIVVVDNNSSDATFTIASKTKAHVVQEKKQGYGWALRRGLAEASGDLLIMAEPDGTFVGKDIFKLLAYADEFDVIFGTRTSRSLIWKGAKMGWFLRMGNVFVAKVLEYLHNGPCLTDVGCTMKLIHRDVLPKIQPFFTVGGSHFSPEFMILCLHDSSIRCLEIPVNYFERIGESKITSNFWKSFKLGLSMLWIVVGYRFGFYGIPKK